MFCLLDGAIGHINQSRNYVSQINIVTFNQYFKYEERARREFLVALFYLGLNPLKDL